MKIYYYTLGCKVNHYETEALKERLEQSGNISAKSIVDADVAIVNSCTVTGQANVKCRQILHKIRKQNANCILILTGCFPQAFEEEVKSFDFCDIICGSANRMSIPKMLNDYLSDDNVDKNGKRMQIISIEKYSKADKIENMSINGYEDKTRANVKIQDGCDQYCSYCIIPYARGHIRSKSLDKIRKEIIRLSKSGHKEVVLVGINLCCYGKDFGNSKSIRLIDAVETACSVEGIERVRLGSIEPEMISDEDVERMSKLNKLCPQFHLSLQSGCDKTLKEMNRKYTAFEYETLCNKLRKAFPDCAITTDIMVGFPGESDEDFLKSLRFVEKMKFSKVHIFPYSMREGTAAAKRTDQIDGKTKEKRAKAMEAVCAKSSEEFLKAQVGKVYPVLFEKEKSLDFYEGHTPNYINVKIPRKNLKKPQNSLRKQILYVKIEKAEKSCCIGSFADDLTMQNLYENKYKEL